MLIYILKRLFLIIPTLFTIITINFFIIQTAPGGPVERMLAQIENIDGDSAKGGFGYGGEVSLLQHSYKASSGLDKELIVEIQKLYGFDKPLWERYLMMVRNYIIFDFGESFYKQQKVLDLVIERLPVSVSLGLWSTLFIYLISIPLGIKKAVQHHSSFDIATSFVVIICHAIPTFLIAILLIILFSGGSFLEIFPLKGLSSDYSENLGFFERIIDYLWHITLPVTALTLGGFASLTLLCKNSFLEEISKQYTLTARAKGANERQILYGHIFRNAMLIVVSGFPAAFVGIFLSGSLLIEIIFSLDGLGLLGYEAALNRDYPIVFGTLYIFTLIGLITTLISDISYKLIDPRIDFEARS
ncbi:microcin ABC transporter permease [Helicobacter monodelphidis]|uniref:microcin C ABC transporter permease YejB n=1 Tax=Helicobacter sp. 15-1451 TaxID=2004995 RepID=UPI000DCC0BEC|nr:microcin C ABC transporter permease YejB [Helicobacter sp. 15-1451]RAX57995.1 microcin ABC transporter permease [Helicobacter sp. 15-1451]